MVEQIFLIEQVKRGMIISIKVVCTSCLTSCQTNFKIKNLRKLGNIRKKSKFDSIIA